MQVFQDPGAALAGRISARTVDEAECVVSVLLAIVFAHLLGASNVSWAAFSGYMVMRGHAAETLPRGGLRIVGTVTGGLLALVAAPLIVPHWLPAALALLVVGTGSLYAALTARYAYAWLFFGLTFAMVVLDKAEHPEIALTVFVETRVLETVAGTLACVLVSLVSTLTLRRIWPAKRTPPAPVTRWHPGAFRHALQAGLALAVLVALVAWFDLPALAQGAITIMAVMVVPVEGIGPSGLIPVSRRIVQRFIGCIAGAVLAAAFLFLAHGTAWVLIAGTILGVALGRHLENGAPARRYIGTQFTLAILVTLVPDSYATAAIAPALERLSGILVGMAVLEPILLAWHVISPLRLDLARRNDPEESGGV